jgi:aspartate aminotransferase-like enzyme
MQLAPGPVDMSPDVLAIGASQPTYFRTAAFSHWLLALKAKFLHVLGVGSGREVIFLTGSGTAGMEAVAVNFMPDPRPLLISSGQFGDRMGEILQRRCHPFDKVTIDTNVSPEANLARIALERYTSCFLTICETTNGYYLDPQYIWDNGFNKNSILICDGISSAFVDNFDFNKTDVIVIGSQKALGLLPGMCFIILSEKAASLLKTKNYCDSLYFDFNIYIENLKRGQIPFTPSLTILQQLDRALNDILVAGGLIATTNFKKMLANRFRERITRHGVTYINHYVSNSVTVINTENIDAQIIVEYLKEKFDITVATNSPPFNKNRFRVSHMGYNKLEDMDIAADAIVSTIQELS